MQLLYLKNQAFDWCLKGGNKMVLWLIRIQELMIQALKGSTIDVKLEILTPKIGLQLRKPT